MNDLNSNSNINSTNNLQTEYQKLNKKLHRSQVINIVLATLMTVFVIVIIFVWIIVAILYNNIKPHFNALLGKNFNIASASNLSEHNKIDLEKFSTKLAFVDDVINLFYYYDKDNKKIEDAMFSSYMHALGDKYAEYYSSADFKDFTEKTTEGVYYGIGCLVTQDLDTNDSIVTKVYKDSPADIGGVKENDIFVSVNGENVRGMELNQIIERIRGEEGAERIIEMYRPDEDKVVKLTVYCGKVDIQLIDSKIIEDNIGYIDIDEFTGKASQQFKTEIDNLLKNQLKGLIIDLRDNPGGELMTVCEMIDYVMRDNDGKFTLNQKESIFDEGKTLLVYIKEKDQIVDAAYADDGHSVEIPIVILTNPNTASAAELFTECLRDYDKAKVVGVRTYGKGVVQNIIPYEDGSAIKFTVSEYFPPSGYSIDSKGILPDYSVDYFGEEVIYDDDNNIVIDDNNTKVTIDSNGQIINTTQIATESEIVDEKLEIENHEENNKIYDYNNKFIDEDWFSELNDKYDDKQLLQAIIILNN